MRLSPITIGKLAEMVCGSIGLGLGFKWDNFPYRSSWKLTKFFKYCGLPYNHDGSSRCDWVEGVLEQLNEKPASSTDLPSVELSLVIKRLFESSEFEEKSLDRQKAIDDVNRVLLSEGLQVNFYEGQCIIENLKTHQTSGERNPVERLMSQEEITRRTAFDSFFAEASEDDFTERLLLPLFNSLGFQRVTITGHRDKSLEFGKDLWMKYSLPTGHILYFGAQIKKGKIGSGEAVPENIGRILSQINMIMQYPIFDNQTNSKHLIDHVFLVASGEITKPARHYLSESLNRESRRNILLLDHKDIIDLCINYSLPLPEQPTRNTN
jgi:hypothetical protein